MALIVNQVGSQYVGLASYSVAGLPVGSQVVDITSGNSFVLTQSTSAVDHSTVEAVLNEPNLRWIRATSSTVATTWRGAMFAFAVSKYSTLATDILADFMFGATGDYATTVTNNGVVNVSSAFNGGVLSMDTGATTVDGTAVSVTLKGNPTVAANVKTGAPWFCAARALISTTPGATSGQSLPITFTQAVSPFNFGAPALGLYGPTSTTNLTLVDGQNAIATSTAADLVNFHDYAIGFDGTTQTAYYGDVMLGTMTAIATSTNLAGLHSGPGQPASYLVASGTVRQFINADKLYCAVANP